MFSQPVIPPPPPRIELTLASAKDDATLRNLYQLYLYEYSQFMTGWRVLDTGRFFDDELENWWEKPGRVVHFVRANLSLAGFVMLGIDTTSSLNGQTHVNEVAEFFVMASLQRQGVGAKVAAMIFDRYPGHWHVYQMNENLRAQTFWRKVIGTYSKGQFTEQPIAHLNGVAQFFDSRSWAEATTGHMANIANTAGAHPADFSAEVAH
jgi:predicted acetyltransferase